MIFDGIDTSVVRSEPVAAVTVNNRNLRAGDEIIAFVNRNLEPYRGYHVFMRAARDPAVAPERRRADRGRR